jgi:hypothetical protein
MNTVKGTAAIRQGQKDISAAAEKYRLGMVSAAFAREEINRIAAFYNLRGVDATAKRHLKAIKPI